MIYSRLDQERQKQNLEYEKLELEKRNQVNLEINRNDLSLLQNKLHATYETYQTKRLELEHEKELQLKLLQSVSSEIGLQEFHKKYQLLKEALNQKEKTENAETNLRIKKTTSKYNIVG